MNISRMYLKQSVSYPNRVLPAILSLTVPLNCVSDFSNLTPLFSLTVLIFRSVFLGY